MSILRRRFGFFKKKAPSGQVTPIITITAQPQNATTSEAYGTASFSVSATVTQGATLSYQWQKSDDGGFNYSNVAGATSNVLNLSSLTYALDEADKYRCIVSATGGATPVNSQDATLTVYDSTSAVASWSSTAVTNQQWRGLCYAKELGLFVAVSTNGTNRIMVSNNGTNWTEISGMSGAYWTVAWSPELGMFVAAGWSGAIATSYDGYNWTARTSPSTNEYRKIRWIPEKGFFLACSSSSTTANRFIKSADGITWTGHSAPSTSLNVDFDYSPTLDLFVAPAYASNQFFTSSDGETWSSITSNASGFNWHGICWSAERSIFVAVDMTFGRSIVSSNGSSWTLSSSGISNGISVISYSSDLGVFFGSSNSGSTAQKFRISTNGLNWSLVGPSISASFRDIVWSSDLGRFVALSDNSGSFYLSTPVYNAQNVIQLTSFTKAADTYRNDSANQNSFVATAQIGSGSIDYQWQKSTDNGVSFSNVAGAASATLSLSQADRNASLDGGGHIYRLKISSASAKYSPVYAGYYNPPVIEDSIYAVTNLSSTTFPSANQWYGLCYAKELGLFVSVGRAGTNRIMVSNNGTNWTEVPVTGRSFWSVEWSPDLRMFVAVGGSSNAGFIMTSYDGYVWTQRTAPSTNELRKVKWIPEKGYFVVVSNQSGSVTANKILKSTDGITWTGYSIPAATVCASVAYSPTLDLFAVTNYGSTSIYTSSDLQNWSTITVGGVTTRTWEDIIWANNRFVAGSSDGYSTTSTDGVNWSSLGPQNPHGFTSIAYSPDHNLFFASSYSTNTGTKFKSSPDGSTWTNRGPSVNAGFGDVVWASDLKKFVSASTSTTSVYSSAATASPENVIQLTSFTKAADTYRNDSANQNSFTVSAQVASGSVSYQWQKSTNNGASFSDIPGETSTILSLSQADRNASLDGGGHIYRAKITASGAKYNPIYAGYYNPPVAENNVYSLNNITPTSISSAQSWGEMTWSSEKGIFLASAWSGTSTGSMAISTDGSNWQTISSVTASLNDVLYSDDKDLFVAIGGNFITTSPDGINWTSRTSPLNQNWSDLTYSPSLGIFLAASRTSTSNAVITSSNGTTWTNSATGIAQEFWGVTWSPELGMFAAVGNSGTIMTSTNGTSWTQRTSPNTNILSSIAWSPELGMFAAVARAGTNRIVTSTDGINWTQRTAPEDSYTWRKIIWISDLGMFVSVAETTATNCIMYSADGINWSLGGSQSGATMHMASLAWSPELKRLAMVGFSGTRSFITPDIFTGKSTVAAFTTVPSSFTTYQGSSVGASFSSVAVLSDGNAPSYQWQESTDGINWSNLSGKTSSGLSFDDAETETNNGKQYRVGVSGGVNALYSSPSLINVQSDNVYLLNNLTTPPSVGVSGFWQDVVWVAEKGLFVACASSGTNRLAVSADGLSWLPVNNVGEFHHVSYHFGTFYALGGGGLTMTSTDGLNWSYSVSPGALYSTVWYDSAYSPSLGVTVIAGSGGSARTNNGTTWTAPSNSNFNSVAWSPGLSLFVGVNNNIVRTSTDGTTWTNRTSPAANNWASVAWSPSLGMFAAVATSGTGNRVMTSTDGITWTARASTNEAIGWRRVKWISDLNLFVAVSSSNSTQSVMYSSDGTNWTAATNSVFTGRGGIAWSSELKKLVFVGSLIQTAPDIFTGKTTVSGVISGPSDVVTYQSNTSSTTFTALASVSDGTSPSYQWQTSSDNGSTWSNISGATSSSLVLTDAETESASTNSTKYRVSVTSSATNSPINTSKVNVTVYDDASYKISKWNARQPSSVTSWTSVAWSPSLGIFAAVANTTGTTATIMTSTDGTTWTARTAPAARGWNSIAWSPSLGMFAAVATSGTGNRVMTSTDGITWTLRASADDAKNWESICWSPEKALFVAVATSGTGNRVMTSANGTTWTSRASTADNLWRSVKWSPTANGTGLFVAVASSGTTSNMVMTSTDGITWTSRTVPNTNQWYAVEWSADLGIFVAVSITGTGNRAMSSTDGITWTSRTTPANNSWNNVAWSPDLGVFVAVANSGGLDRVMTSTDGTTWSIKNGATDSFWRGIAWSPSLGMFAVVANSGSNLRVMTSSTIP